jgi:hypothetical protein
VAYVAIGVLPPDFAQPAWVNDARLVEKTACPDGYWVTGELYAMVSGTNRIYEGHVVCSLKKPFPALEDGPFPCGTDSSGTPLGTALEATLPRWIDYEILNSRVVDVEYGSDYSGRVCFRPSAASAPPAPQPPPVPAPPPGRPASRPEYRTTDRITRPPPAPPPRSAWPVVLLVGAVAVGAAALYVRQP